MHAGGSRGRARATFGDRSFGYSYFLKGGAGTGGFGGSLPSAATLLVRIPVNRVASVQFFFFLRSHRSVFTYWVSGRKIAPAGLFSAPVLLVCMPAARESERAGTLTFELFPFNSLGLSGVRGEGVSTSPYSQRRRFWYAYKQTGRANVRDICFFCTPAIQPSRPGWVGGK